jgi:hypothetical protein
VSAGLLAWGERRFDLCARDHLHVLTARDVGRELPTRDGLAFAVEMPVARVYAIEPKKKGWSWSPEFPVVGWDAVDGLQRQAYSPPRRARRARPTSQGLAK